MALKALNFVTRFSLNLLWRLALSIAFGKTIGAWSSLDFLATGTCSAGFASPLAFASSPRGSAAAFFTGSASFTGSATFTGSAAFTGLGSGSGSSTGTTSFTGSGSGSGSGLGSSSGSFTGSGTTALMGSGSGSGSATTGTTAATGTGSGSGAAITGSSGVGSAATPVKSSSIWSMLPAGSSSRPFIISSMTCPASPETRLM
mmetsp:Transcript_7758/g.32688  ORF Transcript_7758/g.32688 Transcript_7758/m.32688 type:complete len:202 (+) Transcript_7758:348-953(+)